MLFLSHGIVPYKRNKSGNNYYFDLQIVLVSLLVLIKQYIEQMNPLKREGTDHYEDPEEHAAMTNAINP